MLANTATAAPFGYASYLIYKIGGGNVNVPDKFVQRIFGFPIFLGFDYTDTTVALALYGATVASGLLMMPILKKQNIKMVSILIPCWKWIWKIVQKISGNSMVLAGFAVATTTTFYFIDKIAAYWT